jgi:hypothetical protein
MRSCHVLLNAHRSCLSSPNESLAPTSTPAPAPASAQAPVLVGAVGSGWVVLRGSQLCSLHYARAQEQLVFAGMLTGHRLPLVELDAPISITPDKV